MVWTLTLISTSFSNIKKYDIFPSRFYSVQSHGSQVSIVAWSCNLSYHSTIKCWLTHNCNLFIWDWKFRNIIAKIEYQRTKTTYVHVSPSKMYKKTFPSKLYCYILLTPPYFAGLPWGSAGAPRTGPCRETGRTPGTGPARGTRETRRKSAAAEADHKQDVSEHEKNNWILPVLHSNIQ